jgi:hypothetical protein
LGRDCGGARGSGRQRPGRALLLLGARGVALAVELHLGNVGGLAVGELSLGGTDGPGRSRVKGRDGGLEGGE